MAGAHPPISAKAASRARRSCCLGSAAGAQQLDGGVGDRKALSIACRAFSQGTDGKRKKIREHGESVSPLLRAGQYLACQCINAPSSLSVGDAVHGGAASGALAGATSHLSPTSSFLPPPARADRGPGAPSL